jgi:hypothetical protein
MYTPEPLISRWAIKRYNQHFGTKLWYPTEEKKIVKMMMYREGNNSPRGDGRHNHTIHFMTNRIKETPQGYKYISAEKTYVCGLNGDKSKYDSTRLIPLNCISAVLKMHESKVCNACLEIMRSNKQYYITCVPPDPEDREIYERAMAELY